MRRSHYRYILSLPERVIRSLAALCGGLLREIGEVAVPPAVRRTTLYRMMIELTLRFLIEEVGQVEGIYPSEGELANNFILRRTASHGIELLGILTFRASPVWVLAALADLTGGGGRLVHEIAEALKAEGLLEPDAGFQNIEQILGGLEKSSEQLAFALNMPPLNVKDLRREWSALTDSLRRIPPGRMPALERLESTWDQLRATAGKQQRSIFAVSSLLAISTITHVPSNLLWLSKAARSAARRTGGMVGEALLEHYSAALRDIGKTGFLNYWQAEFRPYLRGAAEQFSPRRATLTQRVLQFRWAKRTYAKWTK